ncbi:MAG: sensor histidine kinase [Dehalococcoidia bacterium]
MGLVKALARHADAFERDAGILCHVEEGSPVPRLSAPAELAVYRVVQEALSNVRKHSRATKVHIQVGLHKGVFRAVVRDNGIGFEVEDSRRTENGHLGLAGMEERARMLGGTLAIQSMAKAGTQVTLLVPLPETLKALDQLGKIVTGPDVKSRRSRALA